MEGAFKLLGISEQQLSPSAIQALDNMIELCEKYGTMDPTSESILLSHLKNLQNRSKYLGKLKNMNSIYAMLNQKLSEDLNKITRYLCTNIISYMKHCMYF